MFMRFFVCLFPLILFSVPSLATVENFQGFVQIRPGVSLYAELEINNPKMPTVILVNGLTYHTRFWFVFSNHLRAYGYNLLRFDPQGMGRTLLRDGFPVKPFPIQQQARDLNELTMRMGLTGRLNLLGLSYGGGLSMAFAHLFPQRVQNLILVAPYTQPLENADKTIEGQIAFIRQTQPWNRATDEELYAYFLRQQVYTLNPLSEPSTLEFPLKPEGIFELVQGIRKYDFLRGARLLPPKSVHLVIASQDQYIPRKILNQFWNAVPPGARASRLVVQFSEHKIPEAQPAFLAYWTDKIMTGAPEAFAARSYDGFPITNRLTPMK